MATFLVYITFPNETEALRLGRELVEKKLAAGINIVPGVHSIYWWQDELRERPECLLLAQVSAQAYGDLENFVLGRHSYQTPCVIAMPIERGNPAFLQWIDSNCGTQIPCK